MVTLQQFKNISNEDKCNLINTRLKETSKKSFKGENVDFTWSAASRVLKENGIVEIDGVYLTEEQAFLRLQQKKEEAKLLELSQEDIGRLLKLLEPSRYDTLLKVSGKYNYVAEFILNEDRGIKIKAGDGEVKNTTMRVYVDTLEKWQRFVGEQKEYSTLNLLNTALLEFIDRHGCERSR